MPFKEIVTQLPPENDVLDLLLCTAVLGPYIYIIVAVVRAKIYLKLGLTEPSHSLYDQDFNQ